MQKSLWLEYSICALWKFHFHFHRKMSSSITKVRRERLQDCRLRFECLPQRICGDNLNDNKKNRWAATRRLKHARQLARCTMGHTYYGAMLIQFTQNSPERQPLASGYRFLKSILDRLEALLPVQAFLTTVVAQRRIGRPGYSPSAMFRALALRYLLAERYVVRFIGRLKCSPQLRAICGFGDSLPSNSAFSRFFGLVSNRLAALERAISEIVDELKRRLPRIGRKVAVDSTDIESYANPRRTRVRDPDAAWGVRTRKNKTKGERKTEWFFGYKMHSLIDSAHGVPLVHAVRPANEGDTVKLRSLMETARSAHSWFQPEHLMADKGYDSQANHRFLHERGTAPIIHIRRPNSEDGRHSDFYDEMGAPVCGKDTSTLFVRTDPETGRHLYRCPPDGCSLRPRNRWAARYCPGPVGKSRG